MNRLLRPALIALSLAAPLAAHASFLVQQWQGGGAGGNGLSGAVSVMASRTADVKAQANTIDFSDAQDYNGYVSGNTAWPLAKAKGQSGENATANTDFAAHITGSFLATVAGSYQFRTYGDDGVRLLVDGANVINDNNYHSASTNTVSVALTAGSHNLDLVFFEGGGQAVLEFTVLKPGATRFELVTATGSNVPEPGSLALVGLAGLGLWAAGRRRRA